MSANPRPRVLLLIPHLGGGGAERVTALLASGLSREKYEMHLGLITQTATSEALPASVHIHCLGARRVRAGVFRLLRLIRQLKPELILSGMAHLNFLVLLLRPFFPRGTHVLVRQNGTISATLAFGGVPWCTRLLYRLLYRRADRVICQTQAMAEDLGLELGVPENRLAVLPNPVGVEEIRTSSGLNSAPPHRSATPAHTVAPPRAWPQSLRAPQAEAVATRGQSHHGNCGSQQRADPQHRAGQQLLRVLVALPLPHPHQRRHQRLVHRFRNQIDEQVGNQKSRQKCVHGVRAAIDPGNGELLEGGDKLDQNPRRGDRRCRAKNASIDAAALEELRDWG
jgi:glycosyltransferase involved in cell wall biosynthesis